MFSKSSHLLLASVAVAALLSSPAFAISRIISPNVHKGELELEYQAVSTFDDDSAKDDDQSHKLELEYGLTDRMKVELEGVFKKEPNADMEFNKIEAATQFQFFEQGEYWLDSGMKFAYSHALHDKDHDALEAKLLLEKTHGKLTHRLNLGLEHEVGGGASTGFERSALWGSRYRYNKQFEPGLEWQAEFGKASDHHSFNEQEHYAGPALYGEIAPGVKYEAAYLFGVSDAAADGAARLFLEYEMHF